jgi:hypothetical protein
MKFVRIRAADRTKTSEARREMVEEVKWKGGRRLLLYLRDSKQTDPVDEDLRSLKGDRKKAPYIPQRYQT